MSGREGNTDIRPGRALTRSQKALAGKRGIVLFNPSFSGQEFAILFTAVTRAQERQCVASTEGEAAEITSDSHSQSEYTHVYKRSTDSNGRKDGGKVYCFLYRLV